MLEEHWQKNMNSYFKSSFSLLIPILSKTVTNGVTSGNHITSGCDLVSSYRTVGKAPQCRPNQVWIFFQIVWKHRIKYSYKLLSSFISKELYLLSSQQTLSRVAVRSCVGKETEWLAAFGVEQFLNLYRKSTLFQINLYHPS